MKENSNKFSTPNLSASGSFNKKNKRPLFFIAAAFLISWVLFFFFPAPFTGFDHLMSDLFFQIRYAIKGKEDCAPYLSVFNIDEKDLETLDTPLWNRELYARVIQILNHSGVKTIAFDILFKEAGSPEADNALIRETARAESVFYPLIVESFDREESSVNNFSGLDVIPYPERISLRKAHSFIHPFDRLFDSCRGAGSINVVPDSDGTIRRLPLLYTFNGRILPSLTLMTVIHFLDVDPQNVHIAQGSVTLADAILPSGIKKDIVIPISTGGDMLINYAGPWTDSIPSFPYRELSRTWKNPGTRSDLAYALKNTLTVFSDISMYRKEYLKGIFDPVYPHSGILVNSINTILTENFLYTASLGQDILMCFILPIILALMSRIKKIRHVTGTLLLLILTFIILNLIFFINLNLLSPMAVHIFYIFLASIGLLLNKQLQFMKEKKLIEKEFIETTGRINRFSERAATTFQAIDTYVKKQSGSHKDLPLLQESMIRLKKDMFTYLKAQFKNHEKNEGETLSENNEAARNEEILASSIDSLIGGLFHEILNPLGGIYAPLENLQNQLEKSGLTGDDRISGYFKHIFDNLERIEELVKRFKILETQTGLPVAPVEFENLAEDLTKLFAKKMGKKIQLCWTVKGNTRLITHYEIIRQILIFLVENAIDAITETGTISLELDTANDAPVIKVKDSGCGIPEAIIKNIFAPFFSGKEEGKGAGLGLYLAKTLAIKTGWNLEARSKEGDGTEFIITGPSEKK